MKLLVILAAAALVCAEEPKRPDPCPTGYETEWIGKGHDHRPQRCKDVSHCLKPDVDKCVLFKPEMGHLCCTPKKTSDFHTDPCPKGYETEWIGSGHDRRPHRCEHVDDCLHPDVDKCFVFKPELPKLCCTPKSSSVAAAVDPCPSGWKTEFRKKGGRPLMCDTADDCAHPKKDQCVATGDGKNVCCWHKESYGATFMSLAQSPEWTSYKATHNKNYESLENEHERLHTYLSNKEMVEQHNAEYADGKHTYWLKLNEYSDLSAQEMVDTMNGYRSDLAMASPAANDNVFDAPRGYSAPASVDWVQQGYVTPVKQQGQCGSCWSFSSTGALEGLHMKQTGQLVSLSEQNLLDCSQGSCRGYFVYDALQFVQQEGGIDTEMSYPYMGYEAGGFQKGWCQFNPQAVGATDNGAQRVQSGSEAGLQAAVAQQPVSIAIDAKGKFGHYGGGVFYSTECGNTRYDLDHAVLAVGYGSENGQDYWLVKNSWGTSWGDGGYIKMIRNYGNNCGVATDACFPL